MEGRMKEDLLERVDEVVVERGEGEEGIFGSKGEKRVERARSRRRSVRLSA